jgi:hypothetical protein
MHGQDGKPGVEGTVAKRQRFSTRLDCGGRIGRALGDHLGRGLDRGHIPGGRLVGAGSGADVEDGAGVAERGIDPRCDSRVGAPISAVPPTDPVVGGLLRLHRPALDVRRRLSLKVVSPVAETSRPVKSATGTVPLSVSQAATTFVRKPILGFPPPPSGTGMARIGRSYGYARGSRGTGSPAE